MFIHVKGKTDRIVNLSAVSSIVLPEANHRVIFNMAYACTMSSMGTRKNGVQLADYIYWDDYSAEQLDELINSKYVKDNFLSFPGCNRLVNKNCISNIKIDVARNRIIININCNIRLREDADLSSDFVYIDATTPEQLEQYKDIVFGLIG